MTAIFRTFWSFAGDVLRQSRWRALLAFALVGTGALVEGFGLLMIVPVIETIGGGDAASFQGLNAMIGSFASGADISQIAAVLGLLVAALLLRTALVAWRQTTVTALQINYLVRKKLAVVTALARAPWSRLSALRHSRVNHVLSSDVYKVSDAASGLIEALVATTTLAVLSVIALAIEPQLTLIAGALVLGGLLLAIPVLRAAREVGDSVTSANMDLLNNTGQFLGALKLATSQNIQDRFVAEFGGTLDFIRSEEMRYVARQNRNRMLIIVIGLLVAGGLATVGLGVMGIPLATFVALMVILARMAGPVAQLLSNLMTMLRSMRAYEVVEALLRDLGVSPPGHSGTVTRLLPAGPVSIDLDGVTYRHAENAGVDQLTLTIEPGAFFGIAGGSGAGKTTLADLLVGLYGPQKGRILVDGDVMDLPAQPSWRDRLAYVSQDAFMLHDTVRANLLWSAPEADADAIARALALAGGDTVVAALPEGLDTLLGERGSLISGGERQRLAIARALLRDPSLLILDEATNAIDIQTEHAILKRLASLRDRMTIVMIAHRVESLALCTQIAIVERGQVTVQGGFEALRPRLTEIAVREEQLPREQDIPTT